MTAHERHRETNEAEYFIGTTNLRTNEEVKAEEKFKWLMKKGENDLTWSDKDHDLARLLAALDQCGSDGSNVPMD